MDDMYRKERFEAGTDFSRYLENLSLNLSPFRRETLNFPPSLVVKGVRGLGQSLAFPHNVKSQEAGRSICICVLQLFS